MERVFITRHLPSDLVEPLNRRLEVGVWEGDDPIPRGELLEAVATADGILCMITERVDDGLLDAAPRLRVVSQMAVGVDNIDVAACLSRGVLVGHTPGVLSETVADTAFALLAAVVRRIPEGRDLVLEGKWGPWSPFHMVGGDLHGTTLGVVGMGRIGRAVADRAPGFGMDIVYSSPSDKPDAPGRRLPLPQLLEEADHVVLCAALTEATAGMIGAPELETMKTSAFLINVARGPLVETDALVEALQTGQIGGAALDVTDPEPLPGGHPLLEFPNCLVVPHIGSASMRTRRAMARMAVENLDLGLRGEVMPAEYRHGR